MENSNFRPDFDNFPWRENFEDDLKKWQQGQTGYPIVDAGVRELWQTGWMHNRVRMVVASFLTKHLLIHWKYGEEWFWDTLIDADLANNTASWQWVAGSGADASPYFRIFNPIIQGKKFDTSGNYVRKWVPELEKLDTQYIHNPWEAPENVLDEAGIKLGESYPAPMVDHTDARNRALSAYERIKKNK
jgi:deoxyribodipyrimidine photo-lyase